MEGYVRWRSCHVCVRGIEWMGVTGAIEKGKKVLQITLFQYFSIDCKEPQPALERYFRSRVSAPDDLVLALDLSQ